MTRLLCALLVLGAATAAADAEMVVIMATVLRELGFERFTIRVNDRKILNALAAKGGFDGSDDEVAAVLRVLDKIDKIVKHIRTLRRPEAAANTNAK